MIGTGFILAASFLWALDSLIRFPLIQKGLSPLVIVFYEHAVLTFLFLPYLWSHRKDFGKLNLSSILSFLIVGGLGSAIATVSFTKAFLTLNPSVVILLQKLQPLFAFIFARLFLKEKLDRFFMFWASLCLLGALGVSFQHPQELWGSFLSHIQLVSEIFSTPLSLEHHSSTSEGYFYVFISVFGWSLTTVFGKKLTSQNISTFGILAGRFSVGFVMLCILMLNHQSSLFFSDSFDYIRLLVMIVLSGLVAMYLYYKGMSRLSAKYVAILEMFFPAFAVVINWIFLDQPLTLFQMSGAGLLLLGSAVLQWRKN
jgi:drug/metabolite transporter (DMT)-like permease